MGVTGRFRVAVFLVLLSGLITPGANGSSAVPAFEIDVSLRASPEELRVGGGTHLPVKVSITCAGPPSAPRNPTVVVHHEVTASRDLPVTLTYPATSSVSFEHDDCLTSAPQQVEFTVSIRTAQDIQAFTQARLVIRSTVGEDGPTDQVQWNATVPLVGMVVFDDLPRIYAHSHDALGRVVGPVPFQLLAGSSVNALVEGRFHRHFWTEDGVDVSSAPFRLSTGEMVPLRLEAILDESIRQHDGSYRLWLVADGWIDEGSGMQVVNETLMLEVHVVNTVPPAPPEGGVFLVWLLFTVALILGAWLVGARRHRGQLRNR